MDDKNRESLIQSIRAITQAVSLPYFEVRVFRNHDALFTYVDKPAHCAGKDKLYLYSCTKPLTVACVLQLMEQGKLALEDPLVKYIPTFEKACYLDNCGQKKQVGPQITLLHLLTMTAGLSYDFEMPSLKKLCQTNAKASTAEIIGAIAEEPLLFAPGTQFRYSFCLDVAARVVEVVSGQRFSDYIQQNVLTPLEMTSCSFRDTDRERMLPQYAAENGKIVPFHQYNELILSPDFDSGGGGLIGSAEDYAKFAATLASGGVAANGYRLLKPESVAAMHVPHIASLHIQNKFTCVQGEGYSYGLGVRTRTAATDFGLLPGEFGWDGAAGTYLLVDPNRQISITMGMHLRNWPEVFPTGHMQIVEQIYRHLFAQM